MTGQLTEEYQELCGGPSNSLLCSPSVTACTQRARAHNSNSLQKHARQHFAFELLTAR